MALTDRTMHIPLTAVSQALAILQYLVEIAGFGT
jgi:hypothetical protein